MKKSEVEKIFIAGIGLSAFVGIAIDLYRNIYGCQWQWYGLFMSVIPTLMYCCFTAMFENKNGK